MFGSPQPYCLGKASTSKDKGYEGCISFTSKTKES